MSKGMILGLFLTLSACSTLDAVNALNPLKDDKGISATVQVGKENHSDTSKQLIKASMTETNTVKGNQVKSKELNDVSGNQTINKTTNVPWWSALLLLLVRPMVILKEVIDLFKVNKREK
jgi:hypothetical protein